MTWNYAYTPQIWPPAFTALVLIALAVYSYRRHSVPGTLPFAIALLLGALWMAGISLEVAAVDASAKVLWIEFQAIWLLPVATAVTCFLIEYAWPGHWLTRRNLVLLFIPCLLSIGLILTNNLHHLVWQGFTFDREVVPLNGPGYWIFLVYGYGLGVLNLVVLAWLFIRSPQHRWPVLLMGVASIIAAWAYMGGPRPIAYTPFGELTVFVFFGLIAAVGSYYIQTGTLGTSAWVTGSAIGLIAAAALAVNNIRDYIHDAEVGRHTLVVALGKRTAERVYQAALIAPYLMVVALALTDARHIGLLAVLLTLPAALGLARDLPRTAPGLPYNELLFRTFKLELLFGACFTIGALLPGLLPAVR